MRTLLLSTIAALPLFAAATDAGTAPAPQTPAPAPAKKAKGKNAARKVKAKATGNKRSIVPLRFKQAYGEHNDTNGSKLSLALKKQTTTENDDGRECLDVDALRAVAKANGIEFKPYEKLNNGQKRMNVGNKLRGLVASGVTVTIGSQKFANAASIKSAVKVEPATVKGKSKAKTPAKAKTETKVETPAQPQV